MTKFLLKKKIEPEGSGRKFLNAENKILST
jgi:hypothetical protein